MFGPQSWNSHNSVSFNIMNYQKYFSSSYWWHKRSFFFPKLDTMNQEGKILCPKVVLGNNIVSTSLHPSSWNGIEYDISQWVLNVWKWKINFLVTEGMISVVEPRKGILEETILFFNKRLSSTLIWNIGTQNQRFCWCYSWKHFYFQPDDLTWWFLVCIKFILQAVDLAFLDF